jgi:hypothetical protein
MSISLIEKWVDVTSDQGQRLIENPDASFALYDPADHPEFVPREWNERKGTNCYAYAMQAPAEIMTPGLVHKGKDPEKYRLADIYNRQIDAPLSVTMEEFKGAVYSGLEKDGLIKADPDELYKPGHYLIALCFSEIASYNIKDFHFMVLNSDSRWSEMTGAGGHVDWKDIYDELLTNPATPDILKNKHTMSFDSLYHVPRGGAATLREQRKATATPDSSALLHLSQ